MQERIASTRLFVDCYRVELTRFRDDRVRITSVHLELTTVRYIELSGRLITPGNDEPYCERVSYIS